MNVIFLDFDGVLSTIHYSSNKDIEERIKLLAEICKEYNAKVVIEAAAKNAIDEETMEISDNALKVKYIFNLFKKYKIECIGRTPNVVKKISNISYVDMWKEDEIRLYLYRHPEIDHYCIIDDDDTKTLMHLATSDLDKVRDHLVTPLYYTKTGEEEGLLIKHKYEISYILAKDNEIKKYKLRSNKIKNI